MKIDWPIASVFIIAIAGYLFYLNYCRGTEAERRQKRGMF